MSDSTTVVVKGGISTPNGDYQAEIHQTFDGTPNPAVLKTLMESLSGNFTAQTFSSPVPPKSQHSEPPPSPANDKPPSCMWKDAGSPQGEGWCKEKDIKKISALTDDKGNRVRMSGVEAVSICEQEFAKGNPKFKTQKGAQKYFCPEHLAIVLGTK